MVFEHRSYRTFLKELLVERRKVNPSYSLRAMALNLGFSSSQLSEALNGKANFSIVSLRKIAKKLKLSKVESDYLCLLGQLESETDSELRENIVKELTRLNPVRIPMQDLTIDQYKQISDWHHSAILELVYLDDFKFTPEKVAKKIGISKAEAELAIERLLRLELLSVSSDGTYHRQSGALQMRAEEKNAAMRKFYRQMFEKASAALDEQTPTQRWSGYETLPVAEEAMPEIRAACDRFFDEVLSIASRYEKKDQVYHLMTHFFSLTNMKEHESL